MQNFHTFINAERTGPEHRQFLVDFLPFYAPAADHPAIDPQHLNLFAATHFGQ